MAATIPINDKVVFEAVQSAEEAIEKLLECDLVNFFGELRSAVVPHFRDVLEALASRPGKRNTLGICLTTPGGQAEVVEKCVEIARHHYDFLYFIVPRMAMSAGTIFCMAGDKIYMDYSSSLGPIDPQVPEKDEKYLVPALGYLDKVSELIEKSRDGTITPAEFMLLEKQDLAMLRFYEQARDLSITLLKEWLANYKFKDWTEHRTTNKGAPVTDDDKKRRAEEIATLLSNNKHWHSHGRFISMKTLKDVVRLEIEDFGADKELQEAVRRYCDVLSSFLNRNGIPYYVYNRHTCT
ncbi:MAG: serine dehydrogenasease [Methylocystis sp.]|nr:MAG: serine dehydrogenasease [Methylocystis sp.]